MGWSQPKTLIQTDNSNVVGVTNQTIFPKRTKSMDMEFYWLSCHKSQDQFRYYWAPGASNLADYSTNHHPPLYHESHRRTHARINVIYTDSLQGWFSPQSLYP